MQKVHKTDRFVYITQFSFNLLQAVSVAPYLDNTKGSWGFEQQLIEKFVPNFGQMVSILHYSASK